MSKKIKRKVKKNITRRKTLVKGRKPKPTKTSSDTLYHGTSSKNLSSIKKHGLLPAGRAGKGATGSKAWTSSGGSRSDMIGQVGVTDRTRSAAFYASIAAPHRGRGADRPIILDVDRTKLRKTILVRRKGSSVGGGKEWDYPARIPPSAIRGYWVYQKNRKTGKKEWVYKKKGSG